MKNFFNFFKKEKIKEKIKAFSLVEVMISLIVISAISAAFVPVMTKKISGKKINVAPKMTYSTNCSTFTKPAYGGSNSSSCGKCSFCDLKKGAEYCIACSCDCGQGKYKVPSSCTCATCTANCEECTTTGECKKCKPGFFLNGSVCTKCTAGYYCPSGTRVTCEAGYYCPEGSISHNVCPAGTYSNAGASSCTNCPAGKYQDGTGASSCKNCTDGKWSAAGRTTQCVDNCTAGYYCKNGNRVACPAGTYSNAGAASCTDCPSHYYCVGGTGATACPAGTQYTGTKAKALSNCTACPANSYSTGGIACTTCTACISCVATTGACSGCATGKYLSAGKCNNCPTHCTACSSASKCSACASGYSGTTCASPNCSANCKSCTSPNTCANCDAGYIKVNNKCEPCPAGTYSTGNATSCSNCDPGKWSKAARTSACTDKCPAGNYCTGGKNQACGSGKYSTAGASACETCASLTAHCTKCNANGGTCTACADGYKLNNKNKCVQDCPSAWATEVKFGNTKLCITTINIGDSQTMVKDEALKAKGVTVYDTSDQIKRYGAVCWRGTTTDDNGKINGYKVKRAVCTQDAAKKACAALGSGWELPNETRVQQMYSYDENNTSRPLRFCDNNDECSQGDQCLSSQSATSSSGTDYSCDPGHLWSKDGSGTSAKYAYYTNGGHRGASTAGAGDWRKKSVRCIKRL